MVNKNNKLNKKFIYNINDIYFIKNKEIKENLKILSFKDFLIEKYVNYNPNIMRWITVKDKENKSQKILIKKKDGTILGGIGGTETGNKISDVFDKNSFIQKQKKKSDNFRKTAISGSKANESCDILNMQLTKSERTAIELYTDLDFSDINKILRNNKKYDKDAFPEEYERLLTNINHISNVLKRAKTKEPIIVYRGIDEKFINTISDKLKIGSMFKDDGFCSTTTNIKVTNNFSSKNGYLFEIHVPKGSHAVSVKSISANESEDEILLNKESIFIIQEIDHDNHKIILELQNNNE